jgi:hypothetical protein
MLLQAHKEGPFLFCNQDHKVCFLFIWDLVGGYWSNNCWAIIDVDHQNIYTESIKIHFETLDVVFLEDKAQTMIAYPIQLIYAFLNSVIGV